MYRPAHFEENRTPVLHALIEAHPLGQLVTHGPQGLDANPLPFELDSVAGPMGTLRAHVARANPLWQTAADSEVLVIFQAAAGYISPNWYPSKPEHHRHVPTWNYAVVHAHGVLRVREDERFLRGLVGRLTRTHERRAQQARPWTMADAPPDYIQGLLQAIVGIEIEVTRLVGKFKLGQNREPRDRLGAADGLAALGACAAEGVEAKRVGREPNSGLLLRTVAVATAGETGSKWDSSPPVAADALLPRRLLGHDALAQAMREAGPTERP